MPSAAPRLPQLDRNLLAVDTALSIASAVVSSALGASWLTSLIVAALAPALLTYVHHPGPGRRRRTAIGLALLALLHLLEALVARLRGRQPRPRVAGVGRAVRLAEVTAGVAFAITVVTLTAPELVLGDSLVTNRPLTLFPGDQPETCPAPERDVAPSKRKPHKKKDREQRRRNGTPKPPPDPTQPLPQAHDPLGPPPDRTAPALELPEDITERADDDDGAVVRYSVRAVDAVDGAVKISCRPPSGSRFRVGTTTVTCTAQDRSGNRASGDFEVRVSAPTPAPDPPPAEPDEPTPPPPEPEVPKAPDGPKAEEVPEDPPPPPAPAPPTFTGRRTIIVDTTEPRGTPVSYPKPPAVDSNGRRVKVVCAPSTVPAGTRLPVDCTATDRNGQSTQGSFLVYVRTVNPG
jgi:hypothetical protein